MLANARDALACLLKSNIKSAVNDAPTHPLSELLPGQSGHVRSLACEASVRRRLLELGLLPGTEVEVVRRAPLGDPLELRLRGYRLSLRAEEARAIAVERVEATSTATPASGRGGA
jgi:ferrous iron transport protein A